MNNSVTDKQKVVPEIEEAIKKYTDIMKNTDSEIAKIKQQLRDFGIPGSVVVKLKPQWHNDAPYLLRKEAEHLGSG